MISDIHFRVLIKGFEYDYSVVKTFDSIRKQYKENGIVGQTLGEAAYFEHLVADIYNNFIHLKSKENIENKLHHCSRYLGGELVSYQYID